MSNLKGIATILVALMACGGTTAVLAAPGESSVTLTVGVPYPDALRGIPGVNVTCLEGCEDKQVRVTNSRGKVTLTGNAPLTIQAEKSGYVTAESKVYNGSMVGLSNEWPPEVRVVVRQLGLADAIATGKIILIWGDEEYLPAIAKETGNKYLSGDYHNNCPGIIIIRKFRDRNYMLWVLSHEAMHAWQGLDYCGNSWAHRWARQSSEAKAWIEATEKDIQEFGNFPNIDGEGWADSPWENQAGFYSHWFMGQETSLIREPPERANKKRALKELYRLAPHRAQYFEDRFGPPPPR